MRKKIIQGQLNVANDTVLKLMNHVDLLNRQLEVQDKAIERKDSQYKALKELYRDDLINGRI